MMSKSRPGLDTPDRPRNGAAEIQTPTPTTSSGTRGRRALGTWLAVVMRCGAAVAAGLLLWVSFPPHDVWWAAPLGAGALTLIVRDRRARSAFGYGTLTGLALFALLLTWTSNVGPDAWLALSMLQAVAVGLMGILLARLGKLTWWPLWTAAAWVTQEALRGRFPFGGFTWGRLAFGQTDGPLLGYASIGGAVLVSFVTALLGALIVAMMLAGRQGRWRAGAFLVLGATALLAAPLLMPSAPTAHRTATVALVQGNVPQIGMEAFAERQAVLNNHANATHVLAQDVAAGRRPVPDLTLWPENSSDLDPYIDPGAYQVIDDAVKAIGSPTLVGAVVEAGPGKVRNSGIVWDPVTGPGATYVKQHPVPFAEYVPYRGLLTRLIGRFAMVPRDFVKGKRAGVLQLGPARIGDVICFEIAYDPLVRETVAAGSQFLVVQTNNATFGFSAETEQQLAMSRLRAVEHGRDVLVVATSGVSAIIAPDGSVRQRADVFTAATLLAEVGLRDGTTIATQAGGPIELILAMLVLVPLARRRWVRWRAPDQNAHQTVTLGGSESQM